MCLYGLGFALSHWSFRRASVCVCLVGFASLQSPWAHTLKASLPCLPLPLHRTSLSPQPSQKNDNPLAPHQPFQNRTIPLAFRRASVCVCFICFASLRNFEHTRLRHPCLACPSRCTECCHSHNHCKSTFIPRSALPHLPFNERSDGFVLSFAKHYHSCLPSKKGRWHGECNFGVYQYKVQKICP